MKCEPENSRRGEALRSTLLFQIYLPKGSPQPHPTRGVHQSMSALASPVTPSWADLELPERLVFSATECVVDAGGVYELPVPTDAMEGSFLLYQYEEKSGDGIRFTVTTDGGRELVDEIQDRSSEQLHVTGAERCTLRWDNTDSWLTPKALSYSIKVVSAGCVKARLEQKLLHAAEHGPLAVVRDCLARGLAVDCTSAQGHTPLMRAALSGSAERTRPLLEARASINATDRHGNTPLHLCLLGRAAEPSLVELLVQGGANLHAANAEGATPVHLASFVGGTAALECILHLRADPNVADARGNSALHLAAAAGHVEVLALLLGAGAAHSCPNAQGSTPLSSAAAAGHVGAVAALLAAVDGEGSATELEQATASAVARAHPPLLSLLLESGNLTAKSAAQALADAPSPLLDAALIASCSQTRPRAALRLLDASASVAAMDGESQDALRIAALGGSAELVALLCRRGARDEEDAMGGTALESCVHLGHTHVVRQLVIASPSSAGRALHLAAASGQTGLTLLLLQGVAPPSAADPSRGETPLHAAAAGGHSMTARALLSKGLPLDARDANGRTAVQAALDAGHRPTALALLEAASGEEALLLCS